MNKIFLALMVFTSLIGRAQGLEGTSATKQTQPSTKVKFKTEIKNSLNAFSDSSQVSQWRMRLDPEVAYNNNIFAMRQDVKGKYSDRDDLTYLDDTRLMVGRQFTLGTIKWQPNIEAWLPTNLDFRNRTDYQGSPGLSLKAKTDAGRLKVSYELNGKQMNYGSTVKSSEAAYKVYNELKNNIKLVGATALNVDFKYSDDWDQKGKRSQKYEMQQGLALKLDEHWDIQMGHLISKKNVNADKTTKSVVLYDPKYSEFFTQLTYIY